MELPKALVDSVHLHAACTLPVFLFRHHAFQSNVPQLQYEQVLCDIAFKFADREALLGKESFVDLFVELPIEFDLLAKQSKIVNVNGNDVKIAGIADLIAMKKMESCYILVM